LDKGKISLDELNLENYNDGVFNNFFLAGAGLDTVRQK